MRKIFLTVLAVTAILFSQAQRNSSGGSSYKNAIGVKVWDGGGISFKHFVSDKNALEFVGYFWNQGTRITGLYEMHMPLSDAGGLQARASVNSWL